MEAVEGVVNVHDLHVWSLGSQSRALACHVTIADIPPSESACILVKLNHVLREHFQISHTTIQFEHIGCGVAWKAAWSRCEEIRPATLRIHNNHESLTHSRRHRLGYLRRRFRRRICHESWTWCFRCQSPWSRAQTVIFRCFSRAAFSLLSACSRSPLCALQQPRTAVSAVAQLEALAGEYTDPAEPDTPLRASTSRTAS